MDLVQPSPQQLDILRKVDNEDVNSAHTDLKIIKEWLKKEPHLPDALDDAFLMNFLRGCKFSLEKTKRKLDMYFTMKVLVPEFFDNRDVRRPELARVPTHCHFAIFPGLTADGFRITFARNGDPNFTLQDTIDFVKVLLMLGDIRLHVEQSVNDIYILDAGIAQMRNLPKVSLPMIKKFFICVQEAYPVRIREVHIINPTPIVSFVIKYAAQFVKDKIMKRIRVHDTLESLHECLPKELLPEELGGSAGKLDDFTQSCMATLEKYRDWFKEQDRLKADLTKRVNIIAHDDLFGLDGSFKKLDID